jgi:hypothetical protein
MLACCGENRRVCPQPIKWHASYELLCENAQAGEDDPLPPLQKILRLRQQIEWSEKNGHWTKLSRSCASLGSAALSSAMGGRANAEMAEKEAADRKSKAQAS